MRTERPYVGIVHETESQQFLHGNFDNGLAVDLHAEERLLHGGSVRVPEHDRDVPEFRNVDPWDVDTAAFNHASVRTPERKRLLHRKPALEIVDYLYAPFHLARISAHAGQARTPQPPGIVEK